jgi:aryl sulfotransferase
MTALLTEQAEQEGLGKIPKFDGDYRGYFYEWLDENNYFEVVASYWAKRGEPNLLFVHYNDMKTDLEGEMRRVAKFLDIELDADQWPAAVERCTFEAMRKADIKIGNFEMAFEGGVEGFLFKGTNGRWREVLGPDELAAYERKVAESLPPDAAHWIEHGGPVE